ncbi:flagellar motor switch protein FliN [Parvularcula maris]|uniref:Flagellar motor switch protein FliN n=1 Tax=Parvularcula maris TaxID=2965077 RepID=A0A9X2L9D7_9PROT|nr:flagellar motor switch protein FliN [Parvularcula maris]MCQ8185526.1 flagellar motor switch protein FliN [Parvularcula maris]
MSDTPEDNPEAFGLPTDDGAPGTEPGQPGEEQGAASEAEIAATLDAMIGGAGDAGGAGPAQKSGGFGAYTNMSALGQVPVEVQVVLGRAKLPIGNILKLGRGAVVEIDRRVGEQVEIHINHRPVARGEIVIVDDDRLGVTLTEIITNSPNLH